MLLTATPSIPGLLGFSLDVFTSTFHIFTESVRRLAGTEGEERRHAKD